MALYSADFRFRRAAFLFGVLLLANVSIAQDTRQQEIANLQAEKATHLGIEGPDRAEQISVQVMKSPLLAGTGGLFPWFGSVYQGTGPGVGAGYLRRLPNSSRLTAVAGVSLNGSTTVRADYIGRRLFQSRVQPYLSAAWTRANDLTFYGLGNDSALDTRASYDFNPSGAMVGAIYRPTSWLQLQAGYRFLTFSTHVNDFSAPPAELEDLSDDTRLSFNGSLVGLTIDTRTSPSYSTRGTLFRAVSSYFSEAHDKRFEFRQTEFEAAQLVPLVREQFVLAFRGLATFSNPDSSNFAPLALLPYLGSGDTLRGFTNRRFVDNDRVLLTGEYRWRPSRYIDTAVFLDAGQVARYADELQWSRMKTSWGFGARFHAPAFTAFRTELAHSSEGYQLVFTTGQPF